MPYQQNKYIDNIKNTLTYPFENVPDVGSACQVAPGLLWIRMPLPIALSHINLWAIEDGKGWTIVDTGMQTVDTTTAWNKLFAGPLNIGGVKRVVVTHMHPDHVGMAGWLTRKFNCRLWMTRVEYLTCRTLRGDTGRAAPDDALLFYRKAGWSEDAIDNYSTRFGNFGKMIHAMPDSYHRLQDKEAFLIGTHQWTVVVGQGHSPEHACLYCPDLKVLISGDQVLPKISSNVSVYPIEPDANPMGEWLASLEKIKQDVPEDVLVLPAHNEPFYGLHTRIDQLVNSHANAFERLRAALHQPKRAVDTFPFLFYREINPSDQFQLGLATGESVAHLNYLIQRGEVIEQLDDNGIAWYRISS